MTPDELKTRTKQFGLRVIRLVENLPETRTATVIGNQLLRCATSVGANYRAACRGRSKAEFIAKLGIVEEEADESAYWLEILVEAKIMKSDLVARLHTEAEELTAIMAKSRQTAKQKK
ncbi:MAG: four helix bundle protein [Planctomycetota bacterium]|jgi:four helix bundle protein